MAAPLYPELAVDLKQDEADARDAVRMMKAGLREEISELKSLRKIAKSAKPKPMTCVDLGAGQPPVCFPSNKKARAAMKRADRELKQAVKNMDRAIKQAERRLAKVK